MRPLPHQDEPIPTKQEIIEHVTKFLKMNRFCQDNKIETFGYTCVKTDSRLGSAVIACLRTILDVDYRESIHLMGQEADSKSWYGSYYDADVVNQIIDDDPPYLQLYRKLSLIYPWDS